MLLKEGQLLGQHKDDGGCTYAHSLAAVQPTALVQLKSGSAIPRVQMTHVKAVLRHCRTALREARHSSK